MVNLTPKNHKKGFELSELIRFSSCQTKPLTKNQEFPSNYACLDVSHFVYYSVVTIMETKYGNNIDKDSR